MGKYEAKNGKNNSQANIKLLLAVCCVIILGLIIAVVCILGGQGRNEPPAGETQGTQGATQSEMKKLTVHSTEEQGDTVLVDTSYGLLKYPYAFSDLIRIEAVNYQDLAALEFTADINKTAVKLFTVWFNGTEGIPVGTLKLEGEEEPVSVTVVFFEMEEGLDEDGRTTFNALQEVFNDIAVSLAENEGFTEAG